ncbi:Cephalosporin-C deacetylase [termite gut metagenome]|uniref:Cephalosporin-C deacetylase n=1 Tax=termite gut metagenome TaxID=433724 RepID=A0A5J4QX57_9ZZZZ
MKRTLLGFFLIVTALSLSAQIQGNKVESRFSYRVPVTNEWVFYAPQYPIIQVIAKNGGNETVTTVLQLNVATDQRQNLSSFSQTITLQKGDSTQVDFSFTLSEPGFYRCTLFEKEAGTSKEVRRFNIGYEPENIISLPDNQLDLKAFWEESKAELAKVEPDYQLKLIPDSSDNRRKLYMVKMKSYGGVEISGYYSVPAKKGKYPAIISYMGYGSRPWAPGGTPGYVEFVLSVRGQSLQQPTNIYGDWITHGLESQEGYYYRGAFLDLIRAIDFVASRPEVNTNAIFAEGGSQGGAFTLAACALDDRICAAAPTIPFLSDYPDYFKIVRWPAEPILRKQRELNINDADLYRVLSYFDIKNLAGWIKCPVIMGVGLQDETCPPHTNFSGYNRISSEKEYRIYPLNGHNTPPSWQQTKMEFFEKHIR